MRVFRLLIPIWVCCVFTVPAAAQVVPAPNTGSLGATEVVDWASAIGPIGTPVSPLPRTVNGSRGTAVTISVTHSSSGGTSNENVPTTVQALGSAAAIQASGTLTSTTPGAFQRRLLLTFRFPRPVRTVGAQVERLVVTNGLFFSVTVTGTVRAFDQLGVELFSGSTETDGSHFIGLAGSSPVIARMEIELAASAAILFANNDFPAQLQTSLTVGQLAMQPDPHFELTDGMLGVQSSIATLDAKLDALAASIGSIAGDVGHQNLDVAVSTRASQDAVAAVGADVSALSTAQAGVSADVQALAHALGSTEAKIDGIVTTLATQGGATGALEARLTALEQKVNELLQLVRSLPMLRSSTP